MAKFKKGDVVRYTPHVIEGTVVAASVTDDAEMLLQVEYTCKATGEVKHSMLDPETLTLVERPEPAPAPAADESIAADDSASA